MVVLPTSLSTNSPFLSACRVKVGGQPREVVEFDVRRGFFRSSAGTRLLSISHRLLKCSPACERCCCPCCCPCWNPPTGVCSGQDLVEENCGRTAIDSRGGGSIGLRSRDRLKPNPSCALQESSRKPCACDIEADATEDAFVDTDSGNDKFDEDDEVVGAEG